MTSFDPTSVPGAALEALVEPVLVTDAQGRLTFANATATRVLGAGADVGRAVSALLERLPARTPDGTRLPPALHPILRALAQGQAVIGAELTLTLEGGPATFLVNTVPLRADDGGVRGTVSVFHDVTGARRLEREAAEHAARLATLVELVNEAVFMVGADGVVEFANGLGRRMLAGVPLAATPAERAKRLDVRHLDGSPIAPEFLPSSRALRGETVSGMDLLVHGADGSSRRARISAHPLRRDGAVYAAVVTWRDVTEETRALADLDAARAAAEEANRLKDDFIAALSHELRTPLQPILGWTEVLRRHGRLDEVTNRAIEVVHRNIRQQVRLVDDLLDLSRILHGKFVLRFETFDLREQVRAAIEASEEAALLKRVRLDALLPEDPVPMWGDAARVQQVVSNLLTNAVKFTPAGGRVGLRLETRETRAVIEVEDSGEGIAEADLAIIFEPFRQGRQTTRRGGLGIGLDLVRRLTELHGGTVTVASPGLGHGARFRVELPLARPETAVAAPPAGARPRLEGHAVLVVEDNADTRDVLKLMLEVEGAAVDTAETGEEALAVADRRRPDVVLCDIGLPDIDGLDVARRMRGRPGFAGVRLIALTGYGQAEDMRQAAEAGFDAHLTKPVNLEQLMALLASARAEPRGGSGGAGRSVVE
jgi:signal transduction histidine kinase/CheY-like chemotaxis protein